MMCESQGVFKLLLKGEITFQDLVLSFHSSFLGDWTRDLIVWAGRAVITEPLHWLKVLGLGVCFSIQKPGLHSKSIY